LDYLTDTTVRGRPWGRVGNDLKDKSVTWKGAQLTTMREKTSATVGGEDKLLGKFAFLGTEGGGRQKVENYKRGGKKN